MNARPVTKIDRDPAKLDEALGWYASGALDEEDARWVEAQLDADPTLRVDLEFDHAIGDAFQRKLDELPVDLGWTKLLQRVRTEAAAEHAGARGTESRKQAVESGESPIARLVAWFSGILTPQLGAAMAVLLAVQTVTVVYLLGNQEPQTVEFRSAAGTQQVPVIRAMFDAGLTERSLREALGAQGASIIDGPNDLGEYVILAPGRDAQAVGDALRQAGVVAGFVIDQRVVQTK
ncbi:MAG: hypothetical protein AB7P21_16020 [Lautropia sp.]